MLEIENKDKFGKIVADSLAKIELTVTDAGMKKRWINAIAKATAEIEANGVFMTYQPEDHSLIIWSQKSNNIYTANGVCQCRAFEQGSPCFHRAAARLVRLYMEPETVSAPVKEAGEIPYLKNTKEPIRVEKYGSVRLPVYN
jgi:hypothetical protein